MDERNCHEYCEYGKKCRYDKGESGRSPVDCKTYYVIEKCIREAEQNRYQKGWDD